jgi:hypothetical protein
MLETVRPELARQSDNVYALAFDVRIIAQYSFLVKLDVV